MLHTFHWRVVSREASWAIAQSVAAAAVVVVAAAAGAAAVFSSDCSCRFAAAWPPFCRIHLDI